MYVTKFKAGNIEVKYISAHSNHTIGPSEDAFLGYVKVKMAPMDVIWLFSVSVLTKSLPATSWLYTHLHPSTL